MICRGCSSAAFSIVGDRVVVAIDVTAEIFDAQSGYFIKKRLKGHKSWVRAVEWIKSAVFNGSRDKVLTASMDNTAKIWDIRIVYKLEKFFSRDDTITLNQAVILDRIYETIVCERLRLVSAKLGSTLFINFPQKIDLNKYVFDFNWYTHLQKDYESLPEEIQIILDPYVEKTDQGNEASTTSAKRTKKGYL